MDMVEARNLLDDKIDELVLCNPRCPRSLGLISSSTNGCDERSQQNASQPHV
jgi:hypothetical protein